MSEVCTTCGSDTENPHFDEDRGNDTICCECFSDRFPFHDACTHDVCDEGEHTLEWDRTTFVCAECKVSSQTLTDHLGHDLTPDMSESESDADADDSDTDVESEDNTPDQATLAAFGEVTA
jgi:hypothetical protein